MQKSCSCGNKQPTGRIRLYILKRPHKCEVCCCKRQAAVSCVDTSGAKFNICLAHLADNVADGLAIHKVKEQLENELQVVEHEP